MAKADGSKGSLGAVLGAVMRAGAAILGAGAETNAKQRSTINAVMGLISVNARLAGFIGDMAKRGQSPKDMENALNLVQAMAVRHNAILGTMQETRTRLRAEGTNRLELANPAPVTPAAAPQPRRVVPNNAPGLMPAPKPTFAE